MNKDKISINQPIVLKTKENNNVYHYKTEFSVYINEVYLALTANIKLKIEAEKNLVSFEDSLLARIMGLSGSCCEDHARSCLEDSINPDLVALGIQPMTLEGCKAIQIELEKDINYFIHSKLEEISYFSKNKPCKV